MKHNIITLFILLHCLFIFPQSQYKYSYQAIIRDAHGELARNTPIGMRINIIQGSIDNEAIYTETFTVEANENGLISIEIGNNPGFEQINWMNGPYFIFTEIDISGGASYIPLSTNQLLSVPYAMHSKTAEKLTSPLIESDPLFQNSNAASISAEDILKLSNLSGSNSGDQDLSEYLTKPELHNTINQLSTRLSDSLNDLEHKIDTSFTTSAAFLISETDIEKLNNLSGINSGDQDLSTYATVAALNDSTKLLKEMLPDTNLFLRKEADPFFLSSIASKIDSIDLINIKKIPDIDSGGIDTALFVPKHELYDSLQVIESRLKFPGGYSNVNLSNLKDVHFNTHLLPDSNLARDIGAENNQWRNFYIGGLASLNKAIIHELEGPIDINNHEISNIKIVSGNIDGTAIGANTPANGYFSSLHADGNVVFNENGEAYNTRIETNNNPNLFFIDGSKDKIGIGTNNPSHLLELFSEKSNLGLHTSSDIQYSSLSFLKSRGALSSPKSVNPGDRTGEFVFKAFTGTQFVPAGIIRSQIEDVISDKKVTASFDFLLSTNMSDTTTVMSLKKDGTLDILYNLNVYGNTTCKGDLTLGHEGRDGQLTLYSEQGANDFKYYIRPNSAATQNIQMTLPADNGDNGQVLTNDGAGNLSWTNKKEEGRYIGEYFGGGYIFFIDNSGVHGLIVSSQNLDSGNGVIWSNNTSDEIGEEADDIYEGIYNTYAIISQQGHSNSAALLCTQYSYEDYNDWHLPSSRELKQIDDAILSILRAKGAGHIPQPGLIELGIGGAYWSSTEYNGDSTMIYNFYLSRLEIKPKNQLFHVRAIREF